MACSVPHVVAFLLVALSTSYATSSTSDVMSSPVKRSTAKYCGRNLAEAISIVCNGVYNSLSKKSSSGYTGLWFEPESGSLVAYLPEAEEEAAAVESAAATGAVASASEEMSALLSYPFRSRQVAGQVLGKRSFQRHIRGAYDECCRKPCSLKELSGYCGTGGR